MSEATVRDEVPIRPVTYHGITASGHSHVLAGNVHGDLILGSGKEHSSLEERCLQSLAFPEMTQRRDTIAPKTETTCNWILEDQQYMEWCAKGGLLWIKGRAGTGKSTLLRSIVRDEEGPSMAHTLSISYFFHHRGTFLQYSVLGLLRSLLHQLLLTDQKLLAGLIEESRFESRCKFEGEPGQGWNWAESDLREHLSSIIQLCAEKQPLRLYVDALDEAGEATARDLMSFFERLRSKVGPRISICVSCRPYPDVIWHYDYVIVVEEHNHQDIAAYLDAQFKHASRWGRQKDADEIKSSLLDRASGVFQWIVLVTYRILQLRHESVDFILNEIKQVPFELQELYEEMLGQLNATDREMALPLMRWVTFAARPLSLEELRYAVTIDRIMPLRSTLDCQLSTHWCGTDKELVNRLLRLSRGLIRLEKTAEGDRVVAFDHESVRDYMLERGIAHLGQQNLSVSGDSSFGREHHFLSTCCVRFLGASDVLSIESSLWKVDNVRPPGCPFVTYAVDHWMKHAVFAESHGVCQADLIQITAWPSFEIWTQWHRLWYDTRNIYPRRTTLQHVAARFGLESVMTKLILMTRKSSLKFRAESLFWPRWRSDDMDSLDSLGLTPLALAADYEQETIVQLLLNTGRVSVNSKCSLDVGPGETPLARATYRGHTEVVKLLLQDRRVNINCQDFDGKTPLLNAVERGYEEIVRLLLDSGKVIHVVKAQWGKTPLAIAARHGDLAIVGRLLNTQNANADSRDEYNNTPFSQAIQSKNEDVARLLLDHSGVEIVDLRNSMGATPLWLAACLGLEGTVRLLLATGKVDMNSQTHAGTTPISMATRNGHVGIVRLLVGCKKVDVNFKTVYEHRTPLALAAANGNVEIVKLLIADSRVEVATRDKGGRTSLALAIEGRHVGIVKLLLDSGRVDMTREDPVEDMMRSEWAERRGLIIQEEKKKGNLIRKMLEQYDDLGRL